MLNSNCRHPLRRPAERGTSLLESILVLMLVSVIASTAVPVGRDIIRWFQLRSAAHELARELQRARLQALVENSPICFAVQPATREYCLVSASDRDQPRAASRWLPSGIRFESVPARSIVFHPWGTASPAGSFILAGVTPQRRLRVIVHLTGRIRIEDL